MQREKTNYVIQSVAHALDVLEQFYGELDELGVTELSKRLKQDNAFVTRVLSQPKVWLIGSERDLAA